MQPSDSTVVVSPDSSLLVLTFPFTTLLLDFGANFEVAPCDFAVQSPDENAGRHAAASLEEVEVIDGSECRSQATIKIVISWDHVPLIPELIPNNLNASFGVP